MSTGRQVVRMLVPAIVLALVMTPVTVRADVEQNDKALKELQDAKLTIDKAIKTAEEYCEGTAVSAHVKVSKYGGSRVVVRCLADDKCAEVHVGVKDGKALRKREITKPPKDAGDDILKTKDVVTMMEKAKVTLSKAIEAAEKHTKGTAIQAVPSVKEDKLQIVVCCKADDKWLNAFVDGETGKVTKTEEVKKEEKEKKEDKDKP